MLPLVLAALLLVVPSLVVTPPTPPASAESAIPPVIWQVVGFTEAHQAPVTIPDPSRYTLQFLPEGRLLARFDCNPGSGDYTATRGVLILTPLEVTRAVCPAHSYAATVQRLLTHATTYRFDPVHRGHLLVQGPAGGLDLQPTLPAVIWHGQEMVLPAEGQDAMRA
jgi:heat shock protein HslJ